MKDFIEVMDLLNKYSSLILMLATVIYVYFTYKLTRETTKLREVETTPFMSIYIKPTLPIEMVIKNIGKAPAYDVVIEFDKKYLDCFSSCCTKDKNTFSYFSPNQQITILMKTYSDLSELDYDYIPIKVNYQSKEGRKFQDIFNISWKSLSSSQLQKDMLKEIKKEINNLQKEIKNIGNIFKDKEYFITNKLKILEFSKDNNEISLIFSNSEIFKISTKEFLKVLSFDIKDLDYIEVEKGNLINYNTRMPYMAEEVFYLLKNK